MLLILPKNILAKNSRWLIAIIGLCLGMNAEASLSGKYTINQKASASATNYKSFSALASDLSKGIRTDSFTANGPNIHGSVEIEVVKGSGPYTEQVTFDAISGTSATQTITLNGNNEILTFNTNYTQLFVLRLNGIDYMTVDGLIIQSTNSTYARCIEMRNESNYISIINCELKMPNMTGTSDVNGYIMVTNGTVKPSVYTNPGKNIIIKNNRMSAQVDGGPYYGIWLCNETNGTSSSGYQVLENNIEHVYYTFIHAAYTVETVIEKNRLHNDKFTRSGYLYGIYLYNYNTKCDAKINANWLYEFNNQASGGFDGRYPIYVYMYGAPNSKALEIVNNLVDIRSNYYTPGIYVYAYAASNADVKLLHNTLHFGGYKTNTYTYGLYMTQMYYANVKCTNNIFYCDWNISGPLYANYFVSGSIVFENNLIHLDGIKGNGTAYCGYNGNNFSSLNDWQTAVNGKGNLNTNPLLSDPNRYDWQPTSLLIANKGQYAGVTSDISSNLRSTAKPDIGAIEFVLDVQIYNASLPNLNYCSNQNAPVSFWVKNNSGNQIKQLPMAFSLNGREQFNQAFDIQLKSKDSLRLTFNNPALFHDGVSSTLSVFLKGTDDDSTNDFSNLFLYISKSPSGGYLTKGKPFDAYFQDGTKSNPDVTIAHLPVQYEVENPVNFALTNYGLNWKLESFCKSGNTFIDSGVVFSIPNGSNKASIEFTPTSNYDDSLVFIGIKAINLINGCDSIFGRWVYICPSPKPKFNVKNACEGDVVEFRNETTVSKGDLTYKWDFGDTYSIADTSDYLHPIYRYYNYGIFNPKLTVILNKYPKFKFEHSGSIEISPVPNIDFAPINACEGEPINFYNNTTIIGGNSNFINFNWDFGDGLGKATIKSPSYQYSKAGSYKVQLTAEYNGCAITRVRNANQFARPVPNFEVEATCNLSPVLIKNTSQITFGNIGFHWQFDNGFSSTLKTPEIQFDSAGNHKVKLLAISEFGCRDSIEKMVQLKPAPIAAFNYSEPCNREFIKFKNTSILDPKYSYQYFWNFSNEGSSSSKEPDYLFKGLGFKDVTLTVQSSNGCQNKTTRSFLVKRQAKADFEASDVCEGESVQFTNRSNIDYGNIDYEWRFGDGNSSHLTSPKKSFAISGNSRTYLVTLVAKVNDGCSDSVTKPITINAKSNPKFKYSVSGRFVSFEPFETNASYSYNWRFGEGTRSNEIAPLHEYKNIDKGSFEACLGLVNNASCLSEWCETVTINLVGVQDIKSQHLKVYPNPARDYLYVNHNQESNIVSVEISDLLGKSMQSNWNTVDNSTIKITWNNLPTGSYLISLKTDKSTVYSIVTVL